MTPDERDFMLKHGSERMTDLLYDPTSEEDHNQMSKNPMISEDGIAKRYVEVSKLNNPYPYHSYASHPNAPKHVFDDFMNDENVQTRNKLHVISSKHFGPEHANMFYPTQMKSEIMSNKPYHVNQDVFDHVMLNKDAYSMMKTVDSKNAVTEFLEHPQVDHRHITQLIKYGTGKHHSALLTHMMSGHPKITPEHRQLYKELHIKKDENQE